MLTTQALVDPSQAVVVSVRNGQPVVTDGPFLESKEYLGGFYPLIDCETRSGRSNWRHESRMPRSRDSESKCGR